MSREKSESFELIEEKDAKVQKISNDCGAICLCLVAPFAPLRIAPRRYARARFSYPDEFLIEDFVEKVVEKFPNKKDRPPLHLLIHSPGGSVESSYMVSRVLRNAFNKIVGFIPHIAASGATVMALSCNEVVMGDISRLSGIDPYYETDDEVFYPLSVVRAFNTLQKFLGTKELDEISYPYQHLVQSITAEKYDLATHSLKMVEGYVRELMTKSGYSKKQIGEIIDGTLYDIEAHEEIIPFDRAKKFGIKVKLFNEDENYHKCWKVMKEWLKTYWLKPSPVHFIRYCFPSVCKPSDTKGFKKSDQ
jgi:hypothetical protein